VDCDGAKNHGQNQPRPRRLGNDPAGLVAKEKTEKSEENKYSHLRDTILVVAALLFGAAYANAAITDRHSVSGGGKKTLSVKATDSVLGDSGTPEL